MECRKRAHDELQAVMQDSYYGYTPKVELGALRSKKTKRPTSSNLDRTVMGTDGKPLHLQTEYEYYTLGIPRPGQPDGDPSRWRHGSAGPSRAQETRAPYSSTIRPGGLEQYETGMQYQNTHSQPAYRDYGVGMGTRDTYRQSTYRGGAYGERSYRQTRMGREGDTRRQGGGRGRGRYEDGIPANLIEGSLEFVGEDGSFVRGDEFGGIGRLGRRDSYGETRGYDSLVDGFRGMGLRDERMRNERTRTTRREETPRRGEYIRGTPFTDRGPSRRDPGRESGRNLDRQNRSIRDSSRERLERPYQPAREQRHQVALDFRLDPGALSLLPADYQNFDFEQIHETLFFTSNFDEVFSKARQLGRVADIPRPEKRKKRHRHRDQHDGTYELPQSENYERNFQIIKKHNSGAFGATAILKLLETATSRWKSVIRPGAKVIGKRISLKKSKTVARSYDREVKMLAIIKGHKNILTILGCHKSDSGDPYGHIFTEFCDLGDVEALFKKYEGLRKYMPEGFLQQLTLDASKALLYLERGSDDLSKPRPQNWTSIMHNDIKPNNIFMRSRPRGSRNIYPIFVMGDFGLASKATEAAEPSCPHFMSPRRIDDARSRRSTPSTQPDDIFSVFISLFQLSTHEFAFQLGKTGIQPLDFSKPNNFKAPYAPWFGTLICKGCTADEKLRPTAREALEKVIKHTSRVEGWGKGGSKSRLWEINWLSEGVVASWDDNKDKRE
ncbi:G2-specific serine/threonine protein kinase [Orbilia ellipsospora]|uniref:non-specific serine/threonine protein kinase n=1 Tax=Orbilia ellipsospora TaxID=2528407 RepID=A0AAV9WUN0_9PEZI